MAPNGRGWEMIRIVTALTVLATVSVALRVLARHRRRISLGVDDYLIFVALACLIGMLIELGLWCSIGGNGKRTRDLSQEELVNFSKIFIANQFTYFFLIPLMKISIVCFYRRLFCTNNFQRISFGLNVLIGTWAAGIFLTCALQCRPLAAFWNKSIDGHCIDGNTFFIVNQVFNVIMDFVVLLLPIPMIWSLQRSWQDKLGLLGVFGIGGFICFASIYRIVVLFDIDSADTTYTVYRATLWTHVEPCIGIICACLPIIRGLFPKGSFSSSRSRSATNSRRYFQPSSASTAFKNTEQEHDLAYLRMPEPIVGGSSTTKSEASDDDWKRSGNEEGRATPDTAAGITVRTEIKVEEMHDRA